ncbi:MAG: hypothetical protein IH899_13980 [Planctomycetes bacterium]|nr:hypothetical protein [Planctomycetota bacterium]
MRHLVLISLLVFTVTFSAGCALSRSGSSTAVMLRRDAATSLKQITERSAGTLSEKETSSELVQASFTQEADRDSEAFPIDFGEEPEQPEWWTVAETETETETQDRSFQETTLSANSTTNVTASNQTGSWKPTRDWTATKTR